MAHSCWSEIMPLLWRYGVLNLEGLFREVPLYINGCHTCCCSNCGGRVTYKFHARISPRLRLSGYHGSSSSCNRGNNEGCSVSSS